MARYSVIVGNIGTVHEGSLLGVARATFNSYVADSKAGYGRAAHEQVTLMDSGEPIKEHEPAPLWSWEYTDTFGGEANYSWVKRGTVEATDERAAVRAAKKAAGLTGAPCRREDQGDTVALYPAGTCTVLFITEEVSL